MQGFVEDEKPYIGEENVEKVKAFLETIPKSRGAIHSDPQWKNVMIVDGEMMLIDMDGLSTGDALYDMQALYVTYISFKEDEPENPMNFLGIPGEVCDEIWSKIFNLYYKDKSDEEKAELLDKIRLLACVTFLERVTKSKLKDCELGQLRIKHTKEHMEELLEKLFK